MLTLASVKQWLENRVVKPFKQYVQEGAAPNLLAWSAAVGFVAGLCPLLGISTILGLFVHFALKLCGGSLHLPMLLLANFVSIPVEVACILPFMRLGELLLGAPRLDASPVGIKDILFNDPGSALKGIGHALVGWAVASPVIIAVLAQTLKPAFHWAVNRYAKPRTADDMHELMLSQGMSEDAERSDIAGEAVQSASPHHTPQALSRRSSPGLVR